MAHDHDNHGDGVSRRQAWLTPRGARAFAAIGCTIVTA
jgi:hypothetical protein